jgi:hypothetical protein
MPGWANIIQNSSIAWRGGFSAGNGYAEFYFQEPEFSNAAWLISPKLIWMTPKEMLTLERRSII